MNIEEITNFIKVSLQNIKALVEQFNGAIGVTFMILISLGLILMVVKLINGNTN